MALNWVIPKSGRASTGDVTITLAKSGKTFVGGIVFRNRKGDMISKSGRITFAIDGNKLYFKEDANGFKLAETAIESKRLQSNNPVLVEYCRKNRGDYALQKDKINGLWYIEALEESKFDVYK